MSFFFLQGSSRTGGKNDPLSGGSHSSTMPLGEVLHLGIQLSLEKVWVEEWRCLWAEATQHLFDVFQKEKATLATMVRLEAQLTKVAAALEEAERRVRTSDTLPSR